MQAFVASTSLKPMARQLLQDRTPAAYAGVEAYARRHTQEDAGALAWLVLGYAHILDKDYAKAVDPLSRAKARAGDLGDYVSFYLGTAYFQSGQNGGSRRYAGRFREAISGFVAAARCARSVWQRSAGGKPGEGCDCGPRERPAAGAGRSGIGFGTRLRRGRAAGEGGRYPAQPVHHHAAERGGRPGRYRTEETGFDHAVAARWV